MSWVRSAVKRVLALTPYRVTRGAPNRFQAIEDNLRHLRRLGYEPRWIIDAGAHLGSFATAASRIFPGATVHMIEPQPACRAALEGLATRHGFTFHPLAVSSEPGTVRMICEDGPDTGAHIAWRENLSRANTDIEATTLDRLFSAGSSVEDRTLLKLDLQGHELLALRGASLLLPSVELILTEVSFFQQLGEAKIPEIIHLLDQAGFDLFDIAGLAGRARDNRLRQGDFVFIRRGTQLWADKGWA